MAAIIFISRSFLLFFLLFLATISIIETLYLRSNVNRKVKIYVEPTTYGKNINGKRRQDCKYCSLCLVMLFAEGKSNEIFKKKTKNERVNRLNANEKVK